MTDKEQSNGWVEWKNFVLKELERIASNQEVQAKEITEIKEQMSSFRTTIKYYSIIGGIVASAVFSTLAKFLIK